MKAIKWELKFVEKMVFLIWSKKKVGVTEGDSGDDGIDEPAWRDQKSVKESD